MKARQDIGCKFGLRPNLLLTLAFAASFFRFVRSALSVLSYSGEYGSPIKTGTRSYIILSLYEKKRKKLSRLSAENYRYFTRKDIRCLIVVDFPSVTIRSRFSPPETSCVHGRSEQRKAILGRVFRSSKARSVIQADDERRRRPPRKEAKEERKVIRLSGGEEGRRTFVAEWRRVERRGRGELLSSTLFQEWKTFFLPLPAIRSMIFASRRTFLPLQPRRK